MRREHKPSAESRGELNPFQRLANEIIIQAVWDWRRLVDAHAWEEVNEDPTCNFEEIRHFFKSEYCELLMLGSGLTPGDVLRQLEKELANKRKEVGTCL